MFTTYLINSWRALKTGFQNPVGAISESRPVGNPNQRYECLFGIPRSSLLQRKSTHNEPTNPIYEIRSSTDPFELTRGSLDPGDPPLEVPNFHNSYDISPHKFWGGEKFSANAKTTMVYWGDDVNEQDESSAWYSVKYEIPKNRN